MDLKELLDYCQINAISNKLVPTEDSVWRSICRDYSEKFHTPLHLVEEMDPEYVILNVYESQLEAIDKVENIEKLLDIIYGIEDPEYVAQKQADLDEFIEEAEEEEKERLAEKRPIHKQAKPKTELPLEDLPKGGMVDLSYMEGSENEG